MFQRRFTPLFICALMAILWAGATGWLRSESPGPRPATEPATKPADAQSGEKKKGAQGQDETQPPVTVQDLYKKGATAPPKPDPDASRVAPPSAAPNVRTVAPAATAPAATPLGPAQLGGVNPVPNPNQAPNPNPAGGAPAGFPAAHPASQIANPAPQTPSPTPPTVSPRPHAPPTMPGSGARTTAPFRRSGSTATSGGESNKVSLRFNEAPLLDFINTIASLLNLEYIMHQGAAASGGSVTINAQISKDDLFAVFEAVLRQNNVGITRDARISNLYYIEPIGEIKKAPNTRVVPRYPPDGNGSAQLREMPTNKSGDQGANGSTAPAPDQKETLDKRSEFATYVIPIEFMGSSDMASIIGTLGLLSPAGTAIDYARSNLLIVTDFKNNVDRLVDVIRALDGRMFDEGNIDLIKMRYSAVGDINEDLKKIFTQGRGDAPIGINFVPLERLNALLVVCNSTRALEEVHRWVDRLDSPQGRASKTHIYHVQNSIAGNIASILAQIYAEGPYGPGGPGGARPPGMTGAPGYYGAPGATGTTGRGNVPFSGAGSTYPGGTTGYPGGTSSYYGGGASGYPGGSSYYGGGGYSGGYSPYGGGGYGGLGGGYGSYPGSGGLLGGMGMGTLGTRTRGTVAPGGIGTVLGGRDGSIRIIVDDLNNSLIIQSSDADYEYLLETIKQLDVLPRQVLIDVKIIQVNLFNNFSLGINSQLVPRGPVLIDPDTGRQYEDRRRNPSSLIANWFNDTGGSPNTTVTTNPVGSDGKPLGTLGIKSFAFVGNESVILGQLQALAMKGQSKILQSPSILALDGQQSRLHVGSQEPVSAGSFAGGVTGGVTTLTNYRDVGTTLEVVPRINASGIVTLEIANEVSSTVPGTAGSGNPSFNTTSLNTTLTVRDGETVVIGGIISETKDVSKTRIPLLGDIPVVGALFGTTTRNSGRRELIILITPRVVRDVESHVAATEDVRMRYKEVDKVITEMDEDLKKTVRRAQERRRREEANRAKKEFEPQEQTAPPSRRPSEPR